MIARKRRAHIGGRPIRRPAHGQASLVGPADDHIAIGQAWLPVGAYDLTEISERAMARIRAT